MSVEAVCEDRADLWDPFVMGAAGTGFMQSWGWGEFKRACGQQVLRLGVCGDAGRWCSVASVYYVQSSVGVSPLTMPHGPVFCSDRSLATMAGDVLREELERRAAALHAPAIRIEPFTDELPPGWPDKAVRAPLDLVPTPTTIVPVSLGDEELFMRMAPKGRYNIRLAIRKGVTVSDHVDNQAVKDFYTLFELTSLRHGFSGESLAFFDQLLQFLGPKRMARIYLARYHGVLQAAAIVVFYGRRATYLYGGSLPFMGAVMAPYALHWRIMQDARAAGCSEYDLYGIAPEGQPRHPYAKFSQFKSRFGGNMFRPVGAHDLFLYDQIADIWRENILALATRAKR